MVRRRTTPKRSEILAGLAALALPLTLLAAQVLTNGTFQNDTSGWTTFDTNPGAVYSWDPTGFANGGAAKITSSGRRARDDGGFQQVTPAISPTDTVTLSFYWKKDWVTAEPSTHRLYVEIVKPDTTSVVQLWEDVTLVQGGAWTLQDLGDISASFDQPGTYTLRLGADFQTGNNNNAEASGWYDEVVLDVTVSAATTTVGNGTDPADADLCPGDGATELDAFTLDTNAGTDTATSVQVTFAAGSTAGVSLVEITSDDGATVFGSVTNPTDIQNIPLSTPISITTATTPYKVRLTPKSHTAMPAPPGAVYAVSGTVTDIAVNNTKTLADATSATVTLDNQSTGNPIWGAITPGDGQIALGWNNPVAADFAEVVILRNTASIGDAPAEGVTYTAGNTVGASTVVFVGSGTSFTDTSVSNGTDYWYKIFARDTCINYSTGTETGPHTPAPPGATTTLGDGTDPANASLCPGAAATELDAFTLQTSSGNDTVTAVEVTFAAGTAVGLGLAEITSDDGITVFGSVTNPLDVQSIPLTTPIGVANTPVQYKVRVTPKSHAAMPGPPGATYAVTGTVTGAASSNSKNFNDINSATVTVDNQSPANAVWGVASTGDGQIDLAWSNPGDADFAQVVILKNTAPITDAPAEGIPYTAGNTIGASTVVFAGTATSFTDTGVVNGTSYWYEIFARDTCVNYATGAQTGPHTPGAPANDATTVVGTTAVVSSCRQITSSSSLTDDANGDGSTLVEFGTTSTGPWTSSCATLSGPSPRQCLVVQLSPGTTYWVRATFSDPDGVSGLNPQVLGPFAVPSCGADEAPPTLLVLAPTRGAVVGGVDRVKVQVFDGGGLAGLSLSWAVDGGAPTAAGVAVNPNYTCGENCSIYEFDLDTTSLANGAHALHLEATDGAGNLARVDWALAVSNQGTAAAGGGRLLRRTRGSQLCQDCHALPTHSSQATSTKYGNWAVECMACHTPHKTRNIYLIREALRTPNSGTHTVQFQFDDRAGGSNPGDLPSDNPGRLSFLGDRSQTLSGTPNAPFDDGVCETCHTRTNHWRNSLSGGDHAHNADTRCLECHGHDAGFMPAGGGDCLGCHGDTSQGGRRPVNPDFGQQSHHVGNGGTMGGTLTAFDCVVCHAEGTLAGDGSPTTNPTYHGGDGGPKTIDLKNADDVAAVFSYDKAAVAVSAGAAANWGSANAVWRGETSTHLDPFCLTCHDSNGASASFNAADGGSAQNPFGDAAITNNYDQKLRGGVVDIRSKVTATTDQDGDGIPDPPQGIYSRHAIRGQSQSRYVAFQNIAGGRTLYEGDATAGQSLLTQVGTDELGNPLWNDTSVMGCGDCHTVDGANGANGNAHGSPSEYLLKDAFGGSTEGTLTGLSFVCWRCHVPGRYNDPGSVTLGDHTGNSNDWQDTTALVGTARISDGKGNNAFAMSCTNCHGGTNFGTIHGTSEVLGVGRDGGSGTRNAYRFMNGASLRFYDPQGWTGTAITCYTLGSEDSWGGCTQHNRGQGFTKPLQRPLSY